MRRLKKFLESKIMNYIEVKVVEEVRRVIEKLPEILDGTIASYVREDHDCY